MDGQDRWERRHLSQQLCGIGLNQLRTVIICWDGSPSCRKRRPLHARTLTERNWVTACLARRSGVDTNCLAEREGLALEDTIDAHLQSKWLSPLNWLRIAMKAPQAMVCGAAARTCAIGPCVGQGPISDFRAVVTWTCYHIVAIRKCLTLKPIDCHAFIHCHANLNPTHSQTNHPGSLPTLPASAH